MSRKSKDVIDDKLGRLLFDVVDQINSIKINSAKDVPFLSLSPKEMLVLEVLGRRQMAMTQLSEALNLKCSTMTQVTDRLVEKKLLRRGQSDMDRRLVVVGLTPEGVRAWEKNEAVKTNALNSILGTLQFEEQVSMLNILGKIRKKLSAENGK